MAPKTEKRPVAVKIRFAKGIAVWPYLSKPDFKFKDSGEFKTGCAIDTETKELFAVARISPDGLSYVKEKGKMVWDKVSLSEVKELLQKLHNEHIETAREEHEKSQKDAKKKGKKPQEFKENDLPFFERDSEAEEHPDTIEFKFKLNHKINVKTGKNAGKEMELWPELYDAKGNKIDPKRTKAIGGGSTIRVTAEVFPYISPAGSGLQLRIKGVQVLELKVWTGGGSAEDNGFESEDEGFDASEAEEEPEEDGEEDEEDGEESGDDQDGDF